MIPINLTNLCLKEYHPDEIGRDLKPFLDANCDGQDWLTTLASELQEIFVFGILRNWSAPARQNLK
jgi:hypothetical protein